MDGSPSSVISMGLGSWGSTGLVLTLGFGVAEISATLVGQWSDIVLIHANRDRTAISADRGRTEIHADRSRIEVQG